MINEQTGQVSLKKSLTADTDSRYYVSQNNFYQCLAYVSYICFWMLKFKSFFVIVCIFFSLTSLNDFKAYLYGKYILITIDKS